MCEGGLGDPAQFRRAVAHHVYIDQAIRARAVSAAPAAFAAYDIGEASIAPGDLLCSARRPAYRSIAERRRRMGDGARTHCDIVVKVDASRNRILAIGGNVRRAVSLKLLPAAREPGQDLRPVGGGRRMFAHLKLRADRSRGTRWTERRRCGRSPAPKGSRRPPGSPRRTWWRRAPEPRGADAQGWSSRFPVSTYNSTV